MPSSSLAIGIDKIRGPRQAAEQDQVAVEEPLEIQLCSADARGAAAKSLSVTMRTPGDDIDLTLGFLVGESIIRSIDDVAAIGAVGAADADTGQQNSVRVELAAGVEFDLQRLERHFYTTSSCGVCGKTSLAALRNAQPPARMRSLALRRADLLELPRRLGEQQHVFQSTGGLHAAAAFDASGDLRIVREDVGRHNAVDKVVGALLRERYIPADDHGLLVSGRASFELMQKTLMAGIPMLAAVSAPSSLAVRLAREFDVTLIGFLREDRFNLYAGAQRITE